MQLFKGFDPIVLGQLIPTSIQTSEPVTAHCNLFFIFILSITWRKETALSSELHLMIKT